MTTANQKKTTASWSDVKKHLADCDQAALLKLVQDLYAASGVGDEMGDLLAIVDIKG
jgi:hypothetical protein